MKTIELRTDCEYGSEGEYVKLTNREAEKAISDRKADPIRGKRTANLDHKTVKELKEIARKRDISYSGLRKSELIEALK